MKFTRRPSLEGILASYEKTKKDLSDFINSNGEQIKQDRLELEVKEREQERATAVLKNIEEIINVPADAE